MRKRNNAINKQGVSLYFAILILSVLMSSLLVLVSISISQIKVIWAIGQSINAFYGADTGVEQALFRIRQQGNLDNFSGNLGDVSFSVEIISNGEIIIKSVGSYRGSKRAIESRY